MPTMEEVREKKAARQRERDEAAGKPVEEPEPQPEPEVDSEPEATEPEDTRSIGVLAGIRRGELTKLKKSELVDQMRALDLVLEGSPNKADIIEEILRAEGLKPDAPKPEEETPDEGKKPAEKQPDEGIQTAPDDGKIRLAGMEVTSVKEKIDFLNCMIHGDPGVGKTFLAGTAAMVPEMSPVLLIDIEGGSKTLRTFDNIDVVRVVDVMREKKPGVFVVQKYAWEVLYEIYELMTADTKYKTVIIDSASEAYEVLMAFVLAKEYVRAEESGRDKHEEMPEQRDWGIARNMFKKFIKAWNDLEKHVIFTALPGEAKDQKSGAVKVGPMFPGKLFKEVPAKMNEVYYLYTKSEKDGVERKLLTQPEGKYYAKTRSMGAPLVLTDPTMEAIFKFAVDPQASKEKGKQSA